MTNETAAETAAPLAPPPGYEPLFRVSPFLETTGPYYFKRLEQGFIVAIRILDKHANNSGLAHGGLLATLADVSPLRMTTTGLSIDFMSAVKIGDWVESHVSILKTGSRLAFANANICVNGQTVASARAVFSII
jgi:acyl-coenzyme A thioesterase 13